MIMNYDYIEQGDCLELMQSIPDGCIDMVLCDLPYGTIKGAALDGWKNQTTQWDERLDTEMLFKQYERILRRNGTAILFSQEPYTSEMRSHKAENMEFAYPLVWKKDHFANALIAKKAPVSYFEDISVFYKKYDSQLLNPLRVYFEKVMAHIGLASIKDINKALGHRRAEHTFYVDTLQFALCTEKTYQELIDRFGINTMDGFKTFAECEEVENKFKRTFNLPEGSRFMGNVLEFKKDYQGLHPTQKPVALLEYLIRTYTNENEIVLDNCMGSGSTCVAAVNTNRHYIGFELDSKYFDIANERIQEAMQNKIPASMEEMFGYTE